MTKQTLLPSDLKKIDANELQQLADQLREELIDTISLCGGHLASNLGAVELTVALHHVFDAPHDKIIWDVGHQSYIHKMLTGRRDKLQTIRQKDGISGFPNPAESPYDIFIGGHAGTSVSAATGLSLALQHSESSAHAIAVIGDGSLTNGMVFEALNHAGALELDNIIVVLNDNEMSISPNVGAIKWFFSRTITSPIPTLARNKLKQMYRQGKLPELLFKTMDRAEGATQGFISGPARLFEAFGFRYVGPINGHNISELTRALQNAKHQKAPVLVHACTKKGKGYIPAEENPTKWHSVTPFNKENGEFVVQNISRGSKQRTYTEVFGQTLLDLADMNPKIIGVTAAMATGTGLDKLQAKHPDRCYDVGICESHAVTLCAGLAAAGHRPVCAIYSSFMQRAFDQIMHDICLQKLPVVLAMDRAGVVGNDGHTHQGVFDLSFLRALPEIILMSPKDENELRNMLYTAVQLDKPVALRYPRGKGWSKQSDYSFSRLPVGKAEQIITGKDILFICYGPVVQHALESAEQLMKDFHVTSTVVNARFAKPLDDQLLGDLIPIHQYVCTVEDHALCAGFGSAVLELIQDRQLLLQNHVTRFGVQDSFVPHASQTEQQSINEYDSRAIYESFVRILKAQPRTTRHTAQNTKKLIGNAV